MPQRPPFAPRHANDIVDEASAESFPASDAPAWTPISGTRAERGRARDAATGIGGALEAKLADLNDRLLRALAEQENIRRRAARERDEAIRFAASDLVRDLLQTADNLRRAIESVPEKGVARDAMTRHLLDGIAATERALLETLQKHGVSRIPAEPGIPFDPHRHQAMFEVDEDRYPAGAVAQILQPGYTYHDRLLRPVLVSIAKPGHAPPN